MEKHKQTIHNDIGENVGIKEAETEQSVSRLPNPTSTVCPKVPEKSNVPCFSAICAWILKPFNLQIAMMVRFVMMYDNT